MRSVLVYGVLAGLTVVALRFVEYRFVVVEHSVEIYGGLVAALFAGAGIWIGLTLTKRRVIVERVPVDVPVEVRVEVPVEIKVEVPVEVRVPVSPDEPFTVNTAQVEALGITPRELEILQLIADGLSTREMAARLFVSENTIKTHCSRLFGKLEANRRTQAVQRGKALRLIP